MKNKYVLFVMGEDRPGIVAAVSGILFKDKFNIEDSSMTILEDHFSMILILSYQQKYQISLLKKKLQKICKELNLFIYIKKFSPVSKTEKDYKRSKPYIITLIGSDRIGIVHKITKLLSSKEINITDVRTEIIGEEKSPVYTMVLEIEIPTNVKVSEFKSDLKKLRKELNVDMTFKPITILEL